MIFKNLKPLHKQHDPDRGDGSGGGGGMKLVGIGIPVPNPAIYKDEGKQSVLLVKLLKNTTVCNCSTKMPIGIMPILVSRITGEQMSKVVSKLKQSFESQKKTDLKVLSGL